MARKLTEREKENKVILRIIARIKTIEKEYGIGFTKRACQRYALQRNAETKLEKEIAQKERELQQLKKRTK